MLHSEEAVCHQRGITSYRQFCCQVASGKSSAHTTAQAR